MLITLKQLNKIKQNEKLEWKNYYNIDFKRLIKRNNISNGGGFCFFFFELNSIYKKLCLKCLKKWREKERQKKWKGRANADIIEEEY